MILSKVGLGYECEMRLFENVLLFFSLFPNVCGWVLAPAAAVVWLLVLGAWLPLLILFCILVSVLFGTIFISAFSGKFSPLIILLVPVIYSSVIQFCCITFLIGGFGGMYSEPYLLASVGLSVLCTANLGRGFETEPSVIIMRGMLSLSYCSCAWFCYSGWLTSYLSVLGVHVIGLALGVFLPWVISVDRRNF